LLPGSPKHEFTFRGRHQRAARAYLGKPATADDLLRIANALAGGGLRQLKLFFIATGREEESDLAELARLLKSLRAQTPGCRLIASFMPLFHAPFTPLQFAAIRGPTPELVAVLAAAVRQAGGEFRWSAYPDEIALMNRLCRAGRRATPALVQFSLRRGMRYYRRLDPALIREMECALPADLGAKTPDDVLPWSDVQAAASSATIWRSYQQACREWEAAPASAAAGNRPVARGAPGAEAPQPAPNDGISAAIPRNRPPIRPRRRARLVSKSIAPLARRRCGLRRRSALLRRPARTAGPGSAEFNPTRAASPARSRSCGFRRPTEMRFLRTRLPTLAPAQAHLRVQAHRINSKPCPRPSPARRGARLPRRTARALRKTKPKPPLCQRRPALPDNDPISAPAGPEGRAVLIRPTRHSRMQGRTVSLKATKAVKRPSASIA
jgi:hypothetical protein